MKSKQLRNVTIVLLALFMTFFTTLNLMAENTEPEAVAQVSSNVESGSVEVGTTVVFSCKTDGAFIMYSINEGEYEEYYASKKIILDTFPICLKAYASKNGVNGDISTFNYTKEDTIKEASTVGNVKLSHKENAANIEFMKVIGNAYNLGLEKLRNSWKFR